MARNKEKINLRNEKIRKRFETYGKRYPHWRTDAIITKLSEDFFLAGRTIEKILKQSETK